MTLATRLLIFALGLVTILLVPSFIIVDMRLRDRMIHERALSLERQARLIADHWAVEQRPHETAARAAGTLAGRVTLIDRRGIIIADAGSGRLTAKPLGQLAAGPEVAEARVEEVGVTLEESGLDQEELYVAVRAPMGIVRVGVELATLGEIFDAARRDIAGAGLAGVMLAAVFAMLFARYVSRPVTELRDIAQALTRGEFEDHPPIDAPGEVGDLAESLGHLSARLKALEAVRRDFIANVSHELCSPLTIASGFAATLARHDPSAEERKQFAKAILSNTGRMQRVINDMLDLSRIETGSWIPRPETVSIAEVADEVMDSLLPAARTKGVTLLAELDPAATLLHADRAAVRQTLGNLSENAMRHTDAGSVTVFSQRAAEGVWLGVRDTGEGIHEQHLTRIFERFYRVDSGRTRRAGGSGLGLAIVKHMVEAHGGKVDVQSELGVGTTIRALFPQPVGRVRAPTPSAGIPRISGTVMTSA